MARDKHDNKKGKEESKSYDYVNIRSRIDALKEFRSKEDDIGLLFALNEGIHGNQGGMGKSDLYKMAKFGTKKLIEEYVDAGVDIITVHKEVTPHLDRTLTRIRELGCKAGVSINPGSSISGLEFLLDKLDLILVMSVNPGFGGQTFINSSLDKIKTISDLVGKRPINIQVDGGVNNEIAPKVIKAGANVIVAGSAVFKEGNVESYKQNIKSLRH